MCVKKQISIAILAALSRKTLVLLLLVHNLRSVILHAQSYARYIWSAVGVMARPNCLRINEHKLQLKIPWICGELSKHTAFAFDTSAACAARIGLSITNALGAAADVAASAAAWYSTILSQSSDIEHAERGH